MLYYLVVMKSKRGISNIPVLDSSAVYWITEYSYRLYQSYRPISLLPTLSKVF